VVGRNDRVHGKSTPSAVTAFPFHPNLNPRKEDGVDQRKRVCLSHSRTRGGFHVNEETTRGWGILTGYTRFHRDRRALSDGPGRLLRTRTIAPRSAVRDRPASSTAGVAHIITSCSLWGCMGRWDVREMNEAASGEREGRDE
jgi:hypothetical protein